MKIIKPLVIQILIVGFLFAQVSKTQGYTEWDEGIIKFKSEDGQFQTRFDIRIFLDGAYFPDDTLDLLSNGTHLRKGRLQSK